MSSTHAHFKLSDFCTGLLTKPFYVVYKLGDLSGNVKMFCIGSVVSESVGYYFSSLTGTMMTITAVERWLHTSRRSLLTVRRVVILYIKSTVLLIVLNAWHMYNWYHANEFFSAFIVIFFLAAALCFFYHWLLLFQSFSNHTSPSKSNTNKSKRH